MTTTKKITASILTLTFWMLFMALAASTVDSIGYALGGVWIYVFGVTGFACLGYGLAQGVIKAVLVWAD